MCSRKPCISDHDVLSYINEDINSNSSNKFALVRKFNENSRTSVCLTYFDGSTFVKKPEARQTKQVNKKPFVRSSDKNIRHITTKCKTCGDNANQNSCGSSTKSATDMSDTLPADLCMRMVGGRVREILDLLALSGNEIGCAEAHRLQKLFKSVIHALDDLQSACCGSPQINTLRNSCKKTVRLSGAGSETSLSNEVLQCKHPRNVCNQCTGLVNTNLKTLIKAAANFGCLYGYAVNSNIVKRR